mgnify:CR=1 FL=1
MSETANPQEVELAARQGKIKVRGSDVLTTLGIAIVTLFGYMVWEHKEDAKVTQTAFVGAIKEMTLAQREMTTAQRVQNCLLATTQNEREAKLPLCERIAR